MLKNSSIKFQKKILADFLTPNTKIPVKNTKDYQKITIKLNFKGIETFESDREYADTRPFYIRNKGELIVGKQNFFNGSIAYIPDHLDGSICSNAIMSFEVNNIDKSYLLAFLSRPSYLNKHKKKANGTGQKELSENDFLNLDILVPDNLNQKKIGAFLSAIDRLIEKQRSRLNLLNQHKRNSINKFFRVNFSSNNSSKIQLNDFAYFVRGVSYKPQNLREKSSSNTITLLRSNNIQKGKILLNEVQYVDSECVNDNQLFLLGDIFICTANGSKNLVGKTAIFTTDISASKFTFGAFMGVIRPHQVKDSNYLYYLLNSVQFKEHLNILLAGTNINNLRGSQVMNLTFTIHKDSKVRDHIGFFLSKFDALIDLEEIKFTALVRLKQGYLQKIFADQEGNS